jgi:hypothetical protein
LFELRGRFSILAAAVLVEGLAHAPHGQQAFALLVDSTDKGAIGIDKAADAVKEFSIRATDIADTAAQQALASLGLSGTDMANKLLAGGDTAQDATRRIVEGLLASRTVPPRRTSQSHCSAPRWRT